MFIFIENNSIVGFDYIFLVLIMIVFCCFIFCYILVEEMWLEFGLFLFEYMVERFFWLMEIIIERKEFIIE